MQAHNRSSCAGGVSQVSSAVNGPIEEIATLSYSLIFLVVALIAGILGLGGIAGTAAEIAKILFLMFLMLLVVSLLFRRWRSRSNDLL